MEEVMLKRVGSLMLALLFTSSVFPAERKAKAVYCVRSSTGEWSLQRWRPLINPRSQMVFAQFSFFGTTLESVRLRRFHPDHEVAFDYSFNDKGKLTGLTGSVDMWGEWTAEANLYPEKDGMIGPVEAKYYSSGKRDRISRPEGSREFEDDLSKVPVYWTIQALPCGSRLQEAEKMNATQE
jgi:hypothetical protein